MTGRRPSRKRATPKCPRALARQTGRTVDFLRGLASDAETGRNPPALTPGVSIDAGALAGALHDLLQPLENAIAALYRADADVVLAPASGRARRSPRRVGVASWVARVVEGLNGLGAG